MPLAPYLVLESILIKSIGLFLSLKATVVAIIAGSNACIFTRFGLDAKLAPAFINSS
jgi:hypothetical protein